MALAESIQFRVLFYWTAEENSQKARRFVGSGKFEDHLVRVAARIDRRIE